MTPDRIDALAIAALVTIVDWAARALVVAAIVALGLAVLRVRRAAVRHAIWTTVLVASLAMPALSVVLPPLRWALPIVSPSAWLSLEHTRPGPASPKAATVPAVASAPGVDLAPAIRADGLVTGAGRASPPPALSVSWPVIALGIYVIGVLVLVGRIGLGWRLAHRLLRAAPLIEETEPLARLRRATETAGLRRVPQLAETHLTVVPMTLSVTRPVVVLPTDWPAWNAATLQAVLVHEVAHIARRDALVQHLSVVYRAVFWFSPFAWWLRRGLTTLAEDASDEAVLESGVDRASYAEIVLGFFAALRTTRRRAHWPAIAMAAGSGGTRRVERILAWVATRRRAVPAWMLLVMAVVPIGLVTVLAASLQPVVTSSLSIPSLEPPIVLDAVPAPIKPTNTTSPRPAKAPAQRGATPPDYRSMRIDGVMTDAVVRDAHGQPVTDLTASDFRLYEDGVEQKIDVFYAMAGGRSVTPGTADARAAGRIFMVFIDDMNIEPANRPVLLRTLETVRDVLSDDDLVGIVSTGHSSIQVDLAHDRGRVRFNEAIEKIRRAGQVPTETGAPRIAAGRDPRAIHTALRTATDLVARNTVAQDERKALLFISGGYEWNPFPLGTETVRYAGEFVADIAELIRAAGRGGWRFYTVNASGIVNASGTMASDSLDAIARGTGGFTISASDVGRGLQQVNALRQFYYVLGYATSNRDPAKVQRRIELRVSRPGVTMDYRAQYIYRK